jgi:PGF-CTERM protein
VLVLGVYRNNGSETFNASEDSVSYKTANDKEVSDVSYVYFQQRGEETTTEESSESERSTATATETDDPTETTASESSEDTETTTESSGDTPGFTPITAVVALVAAALVGWRRS